MLYTVNEETVKLAHELLCFYSPQVTVHFNAYLMSYIQHNFYAYFSVHEEQFVRQYIATQAILSPKLLIKDHKTINEKGEFPTRLVIPAKKFTADLSKLGYLGI